MVTQKVVLGVFRYAESKYGIDFRLGLLLHGGLVPSVQTYNYLLPV